MKRIFAAALAALALCGQAACADDKQDVDQLIRGSVNRTLEILKNKRMNTETKRQRIVGEVDPVFDIPLMAKLALGRGHWPKLEEPQKKEFTDLFYKMLQDSYFDKINLFSDQTVEFQEPLKKESKFHMLTHIISKDRRFALLFKLYKKDSSWKVYDVEFEGVSFIKSYGSQYDRFLQKNSIKALLTKLREKSIGMPEDLKATTKTDGDPSSPTP